MPVGTTDNVGGTTGVRQPVLPTQTAGTTDSLRQLRNQSVMSLDFRSECYPTFLDVGEDVVEVPLAWFFSTM